MLGPVAASERLHVHDCPVSPCPQSSMFIVCLEVYSCPLLQTEPPFLPLEVWHHHCMIGADLWITLAIQCCASMPVQPELHASAHPTASTHSDYRMHTAIYGTINISRLRRHAVNLRLMFAHHHGSNEQTSRFV